MIKIDRGISYPGEAKPGRPPLGPFNALGVGDSFLFLGEENSIHCSVRYHNRKGSAKFSARKTPEGYRVWRIA